MTEKFEFIDAERAAAAEAAELPTVARMCALLEVSKSGFYEWRGRPVSAAQRRRELLADMVRALFEAFDATYGYRRIDAELVRAGERVGPELVRKLMREMDLIPVQPRPFRTTTEPDPDAPDTRRPGQARLHRPATGNQGRRRHHLHQNMAGLAVFGFADRLLHPRGDRVAMADHMRTELVLDAVDMAMRNGWLEADCTYAFRPRAPIDRRPNTGKNWSSSGCVIRSGGRSMLDNALAESFFASLKNERVHHMVYPTRKAAKEDIARYIELFVQLPTNSIRTRRYRTPHEVRTEYLEFTARRVNGHEICSPGTGQPRTVCPCPFAEE